MGTVVVHYMTNVELKAHTERKKKVEHEDINRLTHDCRNDFETRESFDDAVRQALRYSR